MTGAWTIFKRELLAYVVSPVGWVIAVLFYLFRGYDVSAATEAFARAQSDMDLFARQYLLLGSSYFMFVLVPPILTMRSFAEEKRSGSLEMLMTAPVTDAGVVAGKFAAAWTFFSLLWLPTLVLLVVLQRPSYLDAAIDIEPVLCGYAGFMLLGSLFLAVGMFTSSLTENQLLASLAAVIFNFVLIDLVPRYATGGDEPPSGFAGAILAQVNVAEHLAGWFLRGLLATEHVVFYLSSTVLFLFLTVRAVESRKWR